MRDHVVNSSRLWWDTTTHSVDPTIAIAFSRNRAAAAAIMQAREEKGWGHQRNWLTAGVGLQSCSARKLVYGQMEVLITAGVCMR